MGRPGAPFASRRVKESPGLGAELRYCAPRGIPRSVFLGRVVGAGEPQWLPEDTEYALAWQAEQDARCPGCGLPSHETTDPDHPAVYVPRRVECIACEERGHYEDALRKSAGTKPLHGVYVVLDEQPIAPKAEVSSG